MSTSLSVALGGNGGTGGSGGEVDVTNSAFIATHGDNAIGIEGQSVGGGGGNGGMSIAGSFRRRRDGSGKADDVRSPYRSAAPAAAAMSVATSTSPTTAR